MIRVKSRIENLVFDGYGSILGIENGFFIVTDKNDNIKCYSLFEKEISEVGLKIGNFVSTHALTPLGFVDLDILVFT